MLNKCSVRSSRIPCLASESLFQQVNALLISRNISYATFRQPEMLLFKVIPEAETQSKLFHRKALEEWRALMRCHNQKVERGIKMGLLPAGRSPKSLKFDSLDMYMLTMQGHAYVEALLAIVSFGERVLKLRDDSQACALKCRFVSWMRSGP